MSNSSASARRYRDKKNIKREGEEMSEIDYKEKYLLMTKQYVRDMERAESIIHDLVDLCVTEIANVEDVGAVASAQEYLAQ